MRVLIVGAGAIGQYIAVRLAHAGHEPVLFARPSQAQALRAGVTLRADGLNETLRVPIATDPDDSIVGDPFELTVVAVKAYSTPEAVKTIQSITACAQATILTVQNGLGNEEELADAFGADRIMAGALTVVVDRADPSTITASTTGGLSFAPVGQVPNNWLIAMMSSAGIEVQAVENWRALKWSKLCINILGNGVCAALDWTAEQVYADRVAFAVERMCLLETVAVMEKLGLRPVNLIGFPVTRLVRAARALPGGLLRVILRRRVARGRAGKLPSLLMDLRAGKKQTEVSALNGAVALNAIKCGIDGQTNAKIALVVSGIASGEIVWSDYRGHPEKLSAPQ